jgi:aryl-alcohol dehydrogenase-like predicted oxidoreductase
MSASRIILGTEVYSGNWGIDYSAKDVAKILDFALEQGVCEIDTASSYGDDHFVEKLLGDALAGTRNKFKIASKFHINQSGNNKGLPVTTIVDIEKDLKNTLESLKTDYLDIYYFHSGIDEFFFQDRIWEFLNEMVKDGVIKKLGLSLNHGLVKSGSNKQLSAAKEYGISVVQTVLNLISREALEFVIPFCKKEGLEIYGRMPLAKGLLSGKYSSASVFTENDPRGKDPKMTEQILEKVANDERKINIEYAIQWALAYTEKIVIGTKTPEQLLGVVSAVSK